jgi:predicted AlkP superfamily phosphohydrolase/phosphomutase
MVVEWHPAVAPFETVLREQSGTTGTHEHTHQKDCSISMELDADMPDQPHPDRPSSSASNSEAAARSTDPPARRVLIIGLDGATFDVLDPLMEAGYLPRLKEAVESGVAGPLRSTVPPITPAAWTTFLTGQLPGRHGIIDFERYEPEQNRLSLNSTRCLDGVRNIWQILGERGLRVGSVNVPMTYPAVPVNGIMISGFETPGPDADFVQPRDRREEILQRWPDPTFRARWQRRVGGGLKLFAENLAYMTNSFHQGAEMTRWCGDEFGWDVLMVVFKLVDNLQHKTWKYIDPRWTSRSPQRAQMVRDAHRHLDEAVGQLLDYADQHEAAVMIVSDHGHGSLEGKVQPNLLLKQWGYLTLRQGAQGWTRARRIVMRSLGLNPAEHTQASDVTSDLAVDFSRTRACVMHAGMAGFLYLNLKGRQPDGIVPPEEFERLRDELQERFLGNECSVVDPSGQRIPAFTAVHKPEELYGCTREEAPWLPDLMLIPYENLAVVRKIRGGKPVRWLPYRKIEGTHRPDGILIGCGPGVERGQRVRANIVDCAPTVLALLGQPIPDDMQGQPIDGLFAVPPDVTYEAARAVGVSGSACGDGDDAPAASPDDAFDAEEAAAVSDRLRDLGYLQ